VDELVLVKLGGSLLTDKRRPRRARPAVIERLAREIVEARRGGDPRLILGHGSGSFGHVAAAAHDLGRLKAGTATQRASARRGVSAIQQSAAHLHRLVVGALAEAGAAPFSLAPSSFLLARGGRPKRLAMAPLVAALDLGLLPVVYGDVVMDEERGAAICSTEAVLLALVRRLRRRGLGVRRLLWLGETDGVYDRRGRTIPRLDRLSFPAVREMIGAPAGTDVTGGMLLRLETARALARLGIESWIVNGTVPGLLGDALRGRRVPGTRFAIDEESRPA